MNQPIQICSWPRSGTHLLMASIWQNFLVGHWLEPESVQNEYGLLDRHVPVDAETVTIPWAHLFAWDGHFAWDPAGRHRDEDPAKILYIVRHPFCALRSAWTRHGGCSFAAYAHEHLVRCWVDHVASYRQVTTVRFEDLVTTPVEILGKIEELYGLRRRHADLRPVRAMVGWAPGTGSIDSWKSASDAEARWFRHFLARAPEITERFGYHM